MESVDWAQVKSLHIYETNPAWAEIETAPIVEEVQKLYPHIKISRPAQYRHQALPQAKFGMIIAPVLAFDAGCNRLGLGAGWYDRFLAQQPQALKIGLAYQSALIPNGLPIEAHDVPLDKIITETAIISRHDNHSSKN